MQALLALSLVLGVPAPAPVEPAAAPPARGSASEARAALLPWPYLRRPVPTGARFLDHGVIGLRAAAGTPHGYRLDVRVGLFDHLSVGFTSHWLPGQRAPQVWPVGSLAVWRWRGPRGIGVNVGGHYRPVLFPPVDAAVEFTPQTHFGLATMELAAGWFSAGLDVGAAHGRWAQLDPEDRLSFRRRAVFGGGVFARAGNRRVGVTVDALAALGPDPLLVFELAVDLRFGAFEDRPRGGWRDWGS